MNYWKDRIFKEIISRTKFFLLMLLLVVFLCSGLFGPFYLFDFYDSWMFLLLYLWIPLFFITVDYRDWKRVSEESYWSVKLPKVLKKKILPLGIFFGALIFPFGLGMIFDNEYFVLLYLCYIPFIIYYDHKNWRKRSK